MFTKSQALKELKALGMHKEAKLLQDTKITYPLGKKLPIRNLSEYMLQAFEWTPELGNDAYLKVMQCKSS